MAAPKNTFKVVVDGKTIDTRKTANAYTHAVVADRIHDYGKADTATTCVYGWCSRHDLAVKLAATARNASYISEPDCKIYRNVRIVEAIPA